MGSIRGALGERQLAQDECLAIMFYQQPIHVAGKINSDQAKAILEGDSVSIEMQSLSGAWESVAVTKDVVVFYKRETMASLSGESQSE